MTAGFLLTRQWADDVDGLRLDLWLSTSTEGSLFRNTGGSFTRIDLGAGFTASGAGATVIVTHEDGILNGNGSIAREAP